MKKEKEKDIKVGDLVIATEECPDYTTEGRYLGIVLKARPKRFYIYWFNYNEQSGLGLRKNSEQAWWVREDVPWLSKA